jgi:hypothetical protein
MIQYIPMNMLVNETYLKGKTIIREKTFLAERQIEKEEGLS